MIRTILSIAVLTSFTGAAALKADPARAPKSSSSKNKKETRSVVPKLVPAVPLKPGWSLVNRVWMHSDGYKFVNGEVIRVGNQTHKKPPKPPTKRELDTATKNPATKTDPAAAKGTERERNLRQIPASQTGTHL